jgi:cell division protein FtsW
MLNPTKLLSIETRSNIDGLLMFACFSLLIIGFVMVISASLHLGVKMANDTSHYPFKQFFHIVLGLVVAGFVMKTPIQAWEKWGKPLFIVGVVLLLIVLIPGVGIKVNGSIRWLSILGLRVQVSEVMKLISVVYMAGYITRHGDHVRHSRVGLIRPMGWLSLACGLLLLEPDFGSVVVIVVIAMGMMFLAGARLYQFLVLTMLLSFAAIFLVYWSPYRLARVLSFSDPWADARNTGFQLTQALISFGRGEFFGVGLGNGIQKLFYLPEAHTDFLFSVLGEELGLVGVIAIVGLFSILVLRAFAIGELAEKRDETFSALVAYGLGIWFGFQAFINMGVNMGMLPTKGLTLPLMSYGGGSMIVMCGAMALLFRVQYELNSNNRSSSVVGSQT